MQKWLTYVLGILDTSFALTYRKARRKLYNIVYHCFGKLQVRLFSTHISDTKFLRALQPEFQHIDALHVNLKTRPCSLFFIENSYRLELKRLLSTSTFDIAACILTAANQVCTHSFDLLGSGLTSLTPKIDWQLDFKSGYRWDSNCYYADIRPGSYLNKYDIKVPWELSRCQHFIWLGQAYWLTADEKYAQEFVAQVQDWVTQNPPKLGVNWACTMDVAIRSVNWLWSYYFFQTSCSVTDEFRLTFFKSLLAHGRHIITNLEWSETLTNNHYLSDIVGLVYLGILLPELKEAQYWREVGLRELEAEMFKQVYPDGVDFEASTSYHRLVTELFLSATLLARHNGYQFSTDYMQRLEKMLEFLLYVTKPDGTTPLIGDNDNGRLHRLKVWSDPACEWVDFRYLLAIGALLFQRQDFAVAAEDQWEEAIWFWGAEAVVFRQKAIEQALNSPRLASYHFPHAGLYVMRYLDQYMLISAGRNGQNGNGGHAHNDKLSFELFSDGRTWLVDPGAYVYTADYDMRNLFRSTYYHNTIQVADQEQNRFATDRRYIFQLINDAHVAIHHWCVADTYDLFIGEHQGYQRLSIPVLHRRIIYFDKLNQVWVIRDLLLSSQSPTATLYFHFAPGLQLQHFSHEYQGVQALDEVGRTLHIFAISPTLAPPRIEKGWVSPGYGQRLPASIIAWSWPEKTDHCTLAFSSGSNLVETNIRVESAIARFEHLLQTQFI